jgi:hypothetical protein
MEAFCLHSMFVNAPKLDIPKLKIYYEQREYQSI